MTHKRRNRCSLMLLLVIGWFSGSSAMAQSDDGESWDVVVIGGGLMGSSAAWQLAQSGQRVLLLEKQGKNYTQGSSFGDARISRSLGPPGDIWSYMHNRTVAEMQALVDYVNKQGEAASMDDVYVTSPVNYVRHASRLENLSYLPEQKDRYALASTPEAALDIFGLTLPDDAFIVREYKDYSGTINPAAVIELLHRGTRLAGGTVSYGQRVTSLTRLGTGYELQVLDVDTGRTESLTIPRVVSAAGPYTSEVLSHVAPVFEQLITPQRVFLAFFEVEPEYWQQLSPSEQLGLRNLFPAVNSTRQTRASGSFSMVERYTARGTPILKIGGHFQRSDIQDLDAVWAQSLTEEEVAWASDSLLHHLSLLDIGLTDKHLRLDSGYSCVYSLTGSERPYVTYAPMPDGGADTNLVIVAGLSGVGAKGALAYGALARDLLLGQSESDPAYLAARKAFGFERMRTDIAQLQTK